MLNNFLRKQIGEKTKRYMQAQLHDTNAIDSRHRN